MIDRSKFLFLWHSVTSFTRSGYGICTRFIVGGLVRRGYRFVTTHYYGIDPGGMLNIDGVPTLPAKIGSFGDASVAYYLRTLKPNCCILMSDPWAFSWFPKLPTSMSAGPLDHVNYPDNIVDIMREYNYRVSPAKFVIEDWKKKGVHFDYIPHGGDSNVYKPLDKNECRKKVGIDPSVFLYGVVGANSDKEPRKNYPGMLEAFRMMLDNNPDIKDVKMLIYTNPKDNRGIDLEVFVRKWKLEPYVILQDPMLFQVGLKDEEMAQVYNSFDVLVHASYREGFGICSLESMMCGVPVIGSNFSSMPELIRGHGWLADISTYVDTPIGATSAIPSTKSISKCMADAYFNSEKRQKYGVLSRKFSLDFDWNKVIDEMWVPYLDNVIEECTPRDLQSRRIV